MAGWRYINHCVAAQRRITAIHPQPYPIGCILCETWERGQIAVCDACPDVEFCLDRSKRLLFSVNLLNLLSLWTFVYHIIQPNGNWSC